MHFFTSLIVALPALAATVLAQSSSLKLTNDNYDMVIGKEFTLTYTTTQPDQPTTILLRKGPSGDLKTLYTLTANSLGGSYHFIPMTSLSPADDYAIQISQQSEFNYSPEFSIKSAAAPTSVAAYVPKVSPASLSLNSSMIVTAQTVYPMSGIATASGTATHLPMARNTTFSSATIKPTATTMPALSLTPSVSATMTSALPSNAASVLDSSMALVFGAAAVIMYLN